MSFTQIPSYQQQNKQWITSKLVLGVYPRGNWGRQPVSSWDGRELFDSKTQVESILNILCCISLLIVLNSRPEMTTGGSSTGPCYTRSSPSPFSPLSKNALTPERCSVGICRYKLHWRTCWIRVVIGAVPCPCGSSSRARGPALVALMLCR